MGGPKIARVFWRARQRRGKLQDRETGGIRRKLHFFRRLKPATTIHDYPIPQAEAPTTTHDYHMPQAEAPHYHLRLPYSTG